MSTVPHLADISDNTGRWSRIELDKDSVNRLYAVCHGQEKLEKAGYVTKPLTTAQKLARLRCENCTLPMNLFQSKEEAPVNSNTKKKTRETSVCSFHPAKTIRGVYQCCGMYMYEKGASEGCQILSSHTLRPDHQSFLQTYWHFAHTFAPNPNAIVHHRPAVTLDCEFGANKYNENELIRISLVDFFSGQTLIDELVYPNISIKDCRTRYSGITKGDLEVARRQRSCLFGRDVARNRLLNFVGPETVVIVHSGPGDLSSLRLIHPLIIDTQLMDKELYKVEESRGLRHLCEKRLNIKIQRGRKGHDSVEDALATRELLLHYLTHMHELSNAKQDDDGNEEENEAGREDEDGEEDIDVDLLYD